MIELTIPGRGHYRLEHLVLDVNGTLATDGRLLDGVASQIAALSDRLHVHLLTADTHGKQADIDLALGMQAVRLKAGNEAAQKGQFVRELGAELVAAVGNGANDAEMLKAAAIGIAVHGGEGLAVEALQAADVVAASAAEAFGLLQHPARLAATLRK